MSLDKQVRDLFASHGVELARDDIWQVQQATVIKHKAVERLGAAAGVQWLEPTILRAERDEAVILVRGRLGEREDWDIGEALIGADGRPGGNYKVSGKQASYVYAMAMKRGRDRLILKLVGLHGFYSEEEADDFKAAAAPAERQPAPAPSVSSGTPADAVTRLITAIRGKQSDGDLAKLWNHPATAQVMEDADPDSLKRIRSAFDDRRIAFAGGDNVRAG